MSATSNQPVNKNFLSPLGYKFFIRKTPNVNWFVQSVNVPSIALPATPVSNPFNRIPLGGDHLQFGDLSVTFRVDEDLANYLEIYNWLIGIGFPDNFDQYKSIAEKIPGKNITGLTNPGEGSSIYSDATLIITTSAMNPNIEVNFVDIFPIALSELVFDSKLTNVDYIEATVTFSYRIFNVSII